MEKFTLQNMPPATLNRTMRELYIDLIDLTMEGSEKSCLKSVPTNFGYVFFWYGWLNKKNLTKHYTSYIPKEKIKEIKNTNKKTKKTPKKNKSESKKEEQESQLSLQSQISDFLFQITRDHPDVIDEGLAEVYLSILTPKLKHATTPEAAKALKAYAQKLEKLESFTQKSLKRKSGRTIEEIKTNFDVIDYITKKQVEKYTDEYFWDDECSYVELSHRRLGCEIQVSVHFNGDDTLKQVTESIDKAITPIKPCINQIYRYGKPYWPF